MEFGGSDAGGGGEVCKSPESSVDTSAETGGETSVETQNEVEAEGEAAGFEDIYSPDMEEAESEEESENNEIGFGDPESIEESQPEDNEHETRDVLADLSQFEKGKYVYDPDEKGNGSRAYGKLQLSNEAVRNGQAQKEIGGETRQPDDDGGHLIGARFGGSGENENLMAQNSNLNRGSFKRLENDWERELKNGNEVYVDVQVSPSREGRPDTIMGSYVIERPDGSTFRDHFSFTNESKETQEEWNREIESLDDDFYDDYPNPMDTNHEEYPDELNKPINKRDIEKVFEMD